MSWYTSLEIPLVPSILWCCKALVQFSDSVTTVTSPEVPETVPEAHRDLDSSVAFFVGKTRHQFRFSVVIVVVITTTTSIICIICIIIIIIIIIQSLMRDGLIHTPGSWWCCMMNGWLEQISWLSEADQKVLEHDRKSLTHVGVYITFRVEITPQNLLWPFGWFVPWWARC